MLILCIITQCAPQMGRKGDMSVGIVWEPKAVTCKRTCSDPRSKINRVHLMLNQGS